MARRRVLKGVACGIAQSFVSRRNDMDGWWALGVLYALATQAGTSEYTLDLFSGCSIPPDEDASRLAAPFQEYLTNQLLKHKLERHQVSTAVIGVEFDQPAERLPRWIFFADRTWWGEPFVCWAELTDDLGRVHRGEEFGFCGNDPTRGRRSYHRYAEPLGIVRRFDS